MIRTCIAVAVLAILAGCGLNVQSPDLFVLTRTGPGETLTALLNDGGTIRCNGGAVKPLADKLLLDARDLANKLDSDVKSKLHLTPVGRVYSYSVKLKDGTLRFGDTAAAGHSELGQLELLAVELADGPCR
jgi:hypothetical protein